MNGFPSFELLTRSVCLLCCCSYPSTIFLRLIFLPFLKEYATTQASVEERKEKENEIHTQTDQPDNQRSGDLHHYLSGITGFQPKDPGAAPVPYAHTIAIIQIL